VPKQVCWFFFRFLFHGFPVWTKVDGRLNNFANAWLSLSDDQWILSTVIHGYGIELIEPPVQHSIPSGCIMSIEMETIYNQ
jgi:hypothetical protein